MYQYHVLTGGPEKIEFDVNSLKEYVLSLDKKSLIVKEMGSGNDNPHFNVIIETNCRLDNVKRGIKKAYYKDSLQKVENKHLVESKNVKDYEQIKNIVNYLSKEDSKTIIYDGIDYKSVIADMPDYDTHLKAVKESVLMSNSKTKLLEIMIQTYIETYEQTNVYTGDKSRIRPPDKLAFKTVIEIMLTKHYNLTEILKNVKPYFIQWSAVLGNMQYMENEIDNQLQFI